MAEFSGLSSMPETSEVDDFDAEVMDIKDAKCEIILKLADDAQDADPLRNAQNADLLKNRNGDCAACKRFMQCFYCMHLMYRHCDGYFHYKPIGGRVVHYRSTCKSCNEPYNAENCKNYNTGYRYGFMDGLTGGAECLDAITNLTEVEQRRLLWSTSDSYRAGYSHGYSDGYCA